MQFHHALWNKEILLLLPYLNDTIFLNSLTVLDLSTELNNCLTVSFTVTSARYCYSYVLYDVQMETLENV